MDLRGRSCRISLLRDDDEYSYSEGDRIEFRTDGFDIQSSKEELQINLYDLPPLIREQDWIIVGEGGRVQGEVVEITRTSFIIEVKQAGVIYSYDCVKIPGNRIQQLPIVPLEDKVDMKEICTKYCFDFVTLPNTMSGRDIQELRALLGSENQHVQIMARIDTLDAVQNFNGILKQADAIVILRNELTMEMEPEKLMLAQKWMIQTANLAAVPIYVQSQVLEGTLSGNLVQIQKEAREVSQSVIDGVDGFILSHETSIGEQSTEAAILLAKSIQEAEEVYDNEMNYQNLRNLAKQEGSKGYVLDMLCSTANHIALENNVELFCVLTQTGRIARYLAKQRPVQRIMACSTNPQIVR